VITCPYCNGAWTHIDGACPVMCGPHPWPMQSYFIRQPTTFTTTVMVVGPPGPIEIRGSRP
jgi:hypothetical protein